MTYKYELIMYWSDEDETMIVQAPELAGCITDGPTYEDAAREIEIVISLWLDVAKESGWEIPEPKGRRRASAAVQSERA